MLVPKALLLAFWFQIIFRTKASHCLPRSAYPPFSYCCLCLYSSPSHFLLGLLNSLLSGPLNPYVILKFHPSQHQIWSCNLPSWNPSLASNCWSTAQSLNSSWQCLTFHKLSEPWLPFQALSPSSPAFCYNHTEVPTGSPKIHIHILAHC